MLYSFSAKTSSTLKALGDFVTVNPLTVAEYDFMPSSWFFFDAIPTDIFALLILSAGFTSFFTACFGIGGGVMLLGMMAQVLPPQLIIPLHGMVQLGANAGRAVVGWQDIQWRFIYTFLLGAVLGALLGSLVLVALPPSIMYLTITAFIKQLEVDRFRTVATFAMAMSLQHGVKVAVFEGMGISIADWWPLLFWMILSGALGTWIDLKGNDHFCVNAPWIEMPVRL